VLVALAPFESQSANDPGAPDTLRLESGAVLTGRSTRIAVSVFNDVPVHDIDFVLLVNGPDGGWVRFDSSVFIGRLADPSVLPNRLVSTSRSNGVSPDTLVIACLRNNGFPLPPGKDTLIWLYFTGLRPGRIDIDSTSLHDGVVSVDFVSGNKNEYRPYFVAGVIEVYEVDPPPVLSFSDVGPLVSTPGRAIVFDVAAESPMGHPLRLDLAAFHRFDDDSIAPAATPAVDTVSPGSFRWLPDPADVGIWRAEFSAIDEDGRRATSSKLIQVVASPQFVVPLLSHAITDAVPATGLLHGDLDGDGFPEIVALSSATADESHLTIYRGGGSGRLTGTSFRTAGQPSRGAALGFLDGDSHLDLITVSGGSLQVGRGRGHAAFEAVTIPLFVPPDLSGGVLGNFDGDTHPDFATASNNGVAVYAGSASTWFAEAVHFVVGDTAVSICGGDFDRDGFDDLAVVTLQGLEIYRNDRKGGFSRAATYSQAVGNCDMAVALEASEFNGDDYPDLCVATPLEGGARSLVMVYLGRPDGTFEPSQIRELAGAVPGVGSGDFNGDHRLDIALVNDTHGYLALLCGDGSGGFANEMRYPAPAQSPRSLDCLDFDSDGDWDIVVSCSGSSPVTQASLLWFENTLDPTDVSVSTLVIHACDNARLTVLSPDGGCLNDVARSLPSASYYRSRLNDNEEMDVIGQVRSLRSGRYELAVLPRPGQPDGAPFSLEFVVDGARYRLAKERPMSPEGLSFSVYPAGDSPIRPEQGAFVTTALPTFTWTSTGSDRFELAGDIAFTQLLEGATVMGGVYTLPMVLPHSDSTMYYWRVRPESSEAWSETFVFSAVRVPTDAKDVSDDPGLPDDHRLSQNYPNPFNPTTTIEFHLAHATHVTISIHNVLGQLIEILVDETMAQGSRSVDWDAMDAQGRDVASGIYFYRLSADGQSLTRKMVLVR